jgi:hypothetical protein
MKTLRLITPILLFIGTSGLLLNEFLLSWGRSATLIFAGISTLGFAILGIAYFRDKNAEEGTRS